VSSYLNAENLLYTEEVGKHLIYPYTPLSNISIYRRETPVKVGFLIVIEELGVRR
jgi:hypothetical protein